MKYRIIKSCWIGQSGTTHDEYIPQKKFWFWWVDLVGMGFDSVEYAERFIDSYRDKTQVVKEIE